MNEGAALDPGRMLAELRELAALTSNERGAQRVCWGEEWSRARGFLRERLEGLPVETHQDPAGNLWATLAGSSTRALLIGGHLDSVPNGGWLDGALDLLAGLEVLRRFAAAGTPPPVTVRLVDWADVEGARFGRSLLGSSACSGAIDTREVAALRDSDGTPAAELLARHGVVAERMLEARAELETAAAYLELHIEQGPVLERLGLPLGVVLGTFGVERHAVRFTGQAAHAGSTPMPDRHDAFLAASRLALEVRAIARRAGGGVGTTGAVQLRPGIPTAVAGECTLFVDQRSADAAGLERQLVAARRASEEIAGAEGVTVEWRRVWGTQPIPFSLPLIERAERAVVDTCGTSHRLASGPLHDAAEMARAGVPTAMLFVQSLRGLSHTKEEDTRPEHLELAVRALDRLADSTVEWLRASDRGR